MDGKSQTAATSTVLSTAAIYLAGVQDSAVVTNATVTMTGGFYISGINNTLTVRKGGSLSAPNFQVGYSGGISNSAVIDGGSVSATTARIGYNPGASNNTLTIQNGGQLTATAVNVGDSGGVNSLGLVTTRGVLEANTLTVNAATGNSISNVGGIYQFTTATPTITPNGAGRISVTDGTVSFRSIANAPVTPVANLTYAGENTLRLNTASNATGLATYTFDTGLGASNYANLELAGTGSLWRSTSLRIGSGGSLSGSGTVAANTTNAGVIAPGFSPGLITFTSNLVLESSSVLQMEIGGPNPADYDRLIMGGSLSLTGALYVTTLNGYAAPVGTVFTLIDGAVPSTGQFTGLTNGAFVDAGSSFFHIEYNAGDGYDVVLIATVPEPNALLLVGLGLSGLALCRRRR